LCRHDTNVWEGGMHGDLPGKSAPRLVAAGGTRKTTGNTVDAALVARIAAGDRLAMRVLYLRHHARIRRFILHFIDDAALADDLMHEVFLHVWRNAVDFVGGGPISTWLLCVARQKTIQAARRPRHSGHQDPASTVSPTSSEPTEGRI
jgi:RNA polymerase sigma-70 factor (ECF subfamily)